MPLLSQLLTRRRDASASLVLLIVSIGFSLAVLDVFVVNVALPNIAHDFGSAGLGDLSWVLNAYAIVYAALLVVFGRLADRFPREYGFLLGVAVFTVASALCAAANDTLALVVFRVVQAAGAALMTPTSLSMVLATSSGEAARQQRPRMDGDRRSDGGPRTCRGRAARHDQLALGLLRQHPLRTGRPRDRLAAAAPRPRRAHPLPRRARRRPRHRRRRPPDARSRQGRRLGLGLDADDRRARRVRRRDRLVRPSLPASQKPAGGPRPVQAPFLHGGVGRRDAVPGRVRRFPALARALGPERLALVRAAHGAHDRAQPVPGPPDRATAGRTPHQALRRRVS